MSLVVYNANGKFPGRKLVGRDRYIKLYHYTSFESFVKIWLSKSLKFSCIKNVNDVLESILKSQTSNLSQAPLLQAYIDARLKYKQISLTMDYDSYLKGCMSPCMWGYYADKKKGVCIELDYEKITFTDDILKSPVIYKELIKDATVIPSTILTINQLHTFIRKNARTEFFTKQLSWKGENEYRIISRERESLDITNAISAVYLTSYDSDECLFTEKLIDGEVPVKYLHYVASNGFVLPVMTDTKDIRKQMDDAKNNPKNALTKLCQQAQAFYDLHKGDPDYPLIITSFEI